MRIKFVIIAALSLISISSFAAPAKEIKLVTTQDSLSYAVGVNMAESIEQNGKYKFDNAMLVKGISDYFAKKLRIEPEEALNLLNDYFTVRMPAEAMKEANAYGDTVGRSNPYVKETESGLLYQIIDSGDNDTKVTHERQTVVVHYDIFLRDGSNVDSSRKRGEPAEFTVGGVVTGFAEGLKLIGKGGQIKLWIPPALAYGENGAGSDIGPYQWLIVDLELIDILDNNVGDDDGEDDGEYEIME